MYVQARLVVPEPLVYENIKNGIPCLGKEFVCVCVGGGVWGVCRRGVCVGVWNRPTEAASLCMWYIKLNKG